MKQVYRTISKRAEAEFVEKRSRFIATAMPVETEAEAVALIEELRRKNWDATHNVYAYIIENNNIMRYSDDGEPSGTAGVPVLDILKKEELTNLVVVVTRYFGGILLGTGGLVHAYSKSAKLGVEAAGPVTMALCRETKLRCEYTMLGRIQSELRSRGLVCGEPTYSDTVEIPVNVPVEDLESFKADLIDLTNAAISFTDGGTQYRPID